MNINSKLIIGLATAWGLAGGAAGIYGLTRPDCNVSPLQVTNAITDASNHLRDGAGFYTKTSGHEQLFYAPEFLGEDPARIDYILAKMDRTEQQAVSTYNVVKLCDIYNTVRELNDSLWTNLAETTKLPPDIQQEFIRVELSPSDTVETECHAPTVWGKILASTVTVWTPHL